MNVARNVVRNVTRKVASNVVRNLGSLVCEDEKSQCLCCKYILGMFSSVAFACFKAQSCEVCCPESCEECCEDCCEECCEYQYLLGIVSEIPYFFVIQGSMK